MSHGHEASYSKPLKTTFISSRLRDPTFVARRVMGAREIRMKLSLTPALGFSTAPRTEVSDEIRALRPKARPAPTFDAVRPIVAEPPSASEIR